MLTNIINLIQIGGSFTEKRDQNAEFRKSLLFFIKRIFKNPSKIFLLTKFN